MLTLFSCPKGFDNPHIDIIQRNAIESWLALPMEKTIILCGDDPGVKEICEEYGIIHIGNIAVNEFGTPYLNDVFRQAENASNSPYTCYINCDIILFPEFAGTFQSMIKSIKPDMDFLATGQRWLVDITTRVFDKQELRKYLCNSKLDIKAAVDYFIFRRGFYQKMPEFLIGRWYWDNWLVWWAISRNALLLDLTPSVNILHQNHSYNQIGIDLQILKDENSARANSLEGKRNLEVAGGHACCRDLNYARYVFTDSKISERLSVIVLDMLNILRSLSLKNKILFILLNPLSRFINRSAAFVFYKLKQEDLIRPVQPILYEINADMRFFEKNDET